LRVPRATYRLQLSRNLTFPEATGLIPYLADLGVSDLYASPLMRARPGSTHGYDVVDPTALNPELGTEEDYGRMVGALHRHDMGQLLDIVPNHAGIGGDNDRWLSVLENGPASPYARFFDIDWCRRTELSGKVLLPVLGDHYRAVLEGGELELAFDAEEGSLSVNYYEHRFPLDPKTYPMVLERSHEDGELGSLVAAFGGLPERGATDEESVAERARDAAVYKKRLANLCKESPNLVRAVEEGVRRLNGEGFEALHRLLEAQAYRLAHWRVAGDEINYRRFFAINDLAGLRVEDERVFEETHRLVLELIGRGSVDGLRIDHPDGLYDPAGYLRRLQKAAGAVLGSPEERALYVVVEKILEPHELLPEDWPVSGTTGYEFTNLVNGLFVDPAGEGGMDHAYRRFLGQKMDFEEILYASKKLIMRNSLASELDALSRLLLRISEYGRSYDFTENLLRDALSEVVAHFPVYRTYVTAGAVSGADRRYVEEAISRAKKGTAAEAAVFDFLRDVLLLEVDGPEEYREMVVRFAMKFQQYTGPVMAKGVEDTALYLYNRLVSLNEVGGEPGRFGVSVPEFHSSNAGRMERWPHTMVSSSTHDTKRSEDVRARINVLSEIPDEWHARLVRWGELNGPHRRDAGGEPVPGRNDEYLLYQTLLGAWPLGELDEQGFEEFRRRIRGYMEKAIREAQARTSWTDVNERYEEALARFVDALLDSTEGNLFLEDFLPFQRRVARLGALNGLSQTLLKLTAPGVPDVYQGNELWDFSLVDPDNRRPVDFGLREKLLADLERLDPADAPSLLEHDQWQDGRPKLYLTWKALGLRRDDPELFENGEYVPLGVMGARADYLVAFARRYGSEAAIVAAPRLYARLVDDDGSLMPAPEAWAGTSVRLPGELAGATYRNVLTGEKGALEERDGEALLPAGDLLRGFPVALLEVES
jgi:(1->4)-alpha-D-glucan 1-alpha-D-glucosylmutase